MLYDVRCVMSDRFLMYGLCCTVYVVRRMVCDVWRVTYGVRSIFYVVLCMCLLFQIWLYLPQTFDPQSLNLVFWNCFLQDLRDWRGRLDNQVQTYKQVETETENKLVARNCNICIQVFENLIMKYELAMTVWRHCSGFKTWINCCFALLFTKLFSTLQ